MKPILFAESANTFTTNGIGRLTDAISCTVTEERNGSYELEMEYPVTGQHYSDIGQRKIIVAQPSVESNLQPFRIYRVTKPLNGRVKVYAQHLSYDLSKNVAMPFSVAASSSACASALAGLKTNAVETCPFTFETDVTTNASYTQTTPATIRSRLGGVEGSILDQFGGEYEFDVYKVKFHRQRGSDNGVTLRYGKNITDINQEENIANTITGVVPFWISQDGATIVTLTEKVVYSPSASLYSQHLTIPVNYSGDYENAPSESTLRAAAQAYVNNPSFGVPKVSIDVSFVDLRGTEGYDDAIQLETVHLCDTVTVQFVPLGIDTKAEVVKCEYDVLGEKYNKITIGSIRSNLATTLNDQNAELKSEIVKAGQAAAESTSWLTQFGGYVTAIKDSSGHWIALAFSNNPDPTQNTAQVLLINQNGLGFSSTGLSGPYYSAWTLDGHLTLGGRVNEYGTLTLMGPGSGDTTVQIGKWDKDGLSVSKGAISGVTISYGSGNLLTQMKYGPSAAFSGENALQITGNDRMAIESSAYQVRVSGNSFYGGTNARDGYIDINSAYASILAQTGATITCPGYITLNSGGGTARLQLQNGVAHFSNGDVRIDGSIKRNATSLTFSYVGDADETVTMFLLGSSTNVLEHAATGKFVKWSTSSDKRTKKNIKNLGKDLVRKFFDMIRPVGFEYKKGTAGKKHFGLIAQELEEVFKDLGLDTEIIGELHDKAKTKYIDYPELIGLCLEGIKDLYERIETLEKGSTK